MGYCYIFLNIAFGSSSGLVQYVQCPAMQPSLGHHSFCLKSNQDDEPFGYIDLLLECMLLKTIQLFYDLWVDGKCLSICID